MTCTEADIRRIVREELELQGAEQARVAVRAVAGDLTNWGGAYLRSLEKEEAIAAGQAKLGETDG